MVFTEAIEVVIKSIWILNAHLVHSGIKKALIE